VAQCKYLETTAANVYLIQEKIKRRLNKGNACYHSVQKLLYFRLLSKNVKIIIHKIVILPVVLYRCETLSLILREDRRLRVFEKRVLKRIFGAKRCEVIGGWRKLHKVPLHNLYYSPSIIRTMKTRSMRWTGHVARIGGSGMHIGFWYESQKEKTTRTTKT
jgi:hypothetical protein